MAVVEKRERGEGIEQLGETEGARRATGVFPSAAPAAGVAAGPGGAETEVVARAQRRRFTAEYMLLTIVSVAHRGRITEVMLEFRVVEADSGCLPGLPWVYARCKPCTEALPTGDPRLERSRRTDSLPTPPRCSPAAATSRGTAAAGLLATGRTAALACLPPRSSKSSSGTAQTAPFARSSTTLTTPSPGPRGSGSTRTGGGASGSATSIHRTREATLLQSIPARSLRGLRVRTTAGSERADAHPCGVPRAVSVRAQLRHWLMTCSATGCRREDARYLQRVGALVRGGASVHIDRRRETHHGNA